MSRPLHEAIHRTHGARQDRVESRRDLILFCALMNRRDVLDADRLRDVLDELQFLRRRIKQSELTRWVRDRKRQAWKSRTGADVQNARAAQKRLHGQAIKQVFRDLLRSLANSREIHSLIPIVQLV
jgi:hypothetical protein